MARRGVEYLFDRRVADRGNDRSIFYSRARGEDRCPTRRVAGRGSGGVRSDPRDLMEIQRLRQRVRDLEEIKRLRKRVRDLELQREMRKAETESSIVVWDEGVDGEEYPFFRHPPRFFEDESFHEGFSEDKPKYDEDEINFDEEECLFVQTVLNGITIQEDEPMKKTDGMFYLWHKNVGVKCGATVANSGKVRNDELVVETITKIQPRYMSELQDASQTSGSRDLKVKLEDNGLTFESQFLGFIKDGQIGSFQNTEVLNDGLVSMVAPSFLETRIKEINVISDGVNFEDFHASFTASSLKMKVNQLSFKNIQDMVGPIIKDACVKISSRLYANSLPKLLKAPKTSGLCDPNGCHDYSEVKHQIQFGGVPVNYCKQNILCEPQSQENWETWLLYNAPRANQNREKGADLFDVLKTRGRVFSKDGEKEVERRDNPIDSSGTELDQGAAYYEVRLFEWVSGVTIMNRVDIPFDPGGFGPKTKLEDEFFRRPGV